MNSTAPALPPAAPSSLFQVMRRPRWIGVLFLALAIAAAFALLSQWQLTRAIDEGTVMVRTTEQVQPLTEVIAPNGGISETAEAQRVEISGRFVPEDYVLIGKRLNQGVLGYWVTGHLVTETAEGSPSLAVALGWTETHEAAERIRAELMDAAPAATVDLVGRIVPTEGPVLDEDNPRLLTTLSVAGLVNVWTTTGDDAVYSAYLIVDEAPAGLLPIDSLPPSSDIEINWLNIFYAAEWVIFAVFAIYFWYRLARDAWEREVEEARDAAEALAAAATPSDAR